MKASEILALVAPDRIVGHRKEKECQTEGFIIAETADILIGRLAAGLARR